MTFNIVNVNWHHFKFSPHKALQPIISKVCFWISLSSRLQDGHDDIPLSVCRQSPEVAIKEFRERMVNKSALSQIITASHSSSSIVRDMFRLLKRGSLNLQAPSNVIFSDEAGMDAEGLTRELCHMVMANMTDGKGVIVLFEGQIDHLVPVHSEEYTASNYFKYAGKLIAHSVLHAGFGLTGLSRAITEYLLTEDVNSCLPHLSEEDIPDLDIRESLKRVCIKIDDRLCTGLLNLKI